MLPDTDGYDVCLRIKSNSSTSPIPVIFLSARGEVVDKVRGLSCGAADYITKPFQAAELLARIDAVLGQARNPRVPRLGRPIERAPGERLVARVAIADPALKEHVQQLLVSRFDLADADETPDVVIVEGNAAIPADVPEDVAAIRVSTGRAGNDGNEVIPVDAQLPRIVDLVVRERSLDHDLQAAAEALIVLASAIGSHDRPGAGHGERVASRAVRIVSVADRFEALLADRADRPAVSEQEAIRILQSAVARGELDAAVVAALATQVRSSGAR